MKSLREKMQAYLDNGTRWGWLIDHKNKVVEIYRRDRTVKVLSAPTILSGEVVLRGLILD